MENEVWVVFKNKVALGFFNETNTDEDNFGLEDPFSHQSILEVLRAEKISKSYVKLKESSVLIPPINHGDIYQVEKCEFPQEGLVINFNGFVEEEEEKEEKMKDNLKDYLLSQHDRNMNKINKLNSEFYIANNKVSNGSYKINITHNAKNNKDLLKLEKHFKKWGAFFQKGSSTLSGIGSVCFNIDNKFKKAVNCLETAPYVQGCFIAFDPSDYPDIDFSEDQIPGVDE